MNQLLVVSIGLFAQALFFARTIIQWFKSEHEGKVHSPTLFWKISLLGSTLMLIYGILRQDAAIMLGQLLVYFIYIRNIQLKGDWKPMNLPTRLLMLLAPVAILAYLFFGTGYTLGTLFKNDNNPLLLMVWGIIAQLVFITRFFYQWIYSENKGESVLPLGFWVFSICGSVMIVIYGVFRLDVVLVASHGFGMFVYLRNVLIHFNKKSLFANSHSPLLNKLMAWVSGKIN